MDVLQILASEGVTSLLLTGSRVYGTPREDSDIDVVILTTPEGINRLCDRADSFTTHSGPGLAGVSATMRFGGTNVLACIDNSQFAAWIQGTLNLLSSKPVPRNVAVDEFQRQFTLWGLRPDEDFKS